MSSTKSRSTRALARLLLVASMTSLSFRCAQGAYTRDVDAAPSPDTNAPRDDGHAHPMQSPDALEAVDARTHEAHDANGTLEAGADAHEHPPFDAARPDAPSSDASGADGAVEDAGFGPAIDGCTPGPLPSGLVRSCIAFATGVRTHDVPPVEHSFGTAPPPAGTDFEDPWRPTREGECSQATHDRYWVRARDGRIYRTWHPPSAIDVATGLSCNFGHEHGDDPRSSPLYLWAGGVPFGIVNHAATLAGLHRHEDHVGHKIVVQNLWSAVLGNPANDNNLAFTRPGFHCYWLSKVHQGTHSGDALGHNEHEYQNALMCDDGAARFADAGRETNAGHDRHTESAVKTLTTWGSPGWFKGCDALARTEVSGGAGREPVAGSDTNREIKCARAGQALFYKALPTAMTSRTGHVDYAPRDAGIDELWKPWMVIASRSGATLYTSSAYYVVRNPARLYNDGSLVAPRDVDGDGTLDAWIPTLEACLAIAPALRLGQCATLPAFSPSVARTDWWRLPESPFDGTIRVIHPKRIDVFNASERTVFCTDYRGVETADDPRPDARGFLTCPAGQLFQRIAATQNLWWGGASWGPTRLRGDINGSDVNAQSDTTLAGYGHEWVRFADAPGVHAPN